MSFYSNLRSYWLANTTLQTALPFDTRVWIDAAPPGSETDTPFQPYAVLVALSNLPTWTVCSSYYSTFAFQISVYHTSAATAESLSNTIAGQLTQQAVTPATLLCTISNGPYLKRDTSTPVTLYHCFMEFQYMDNKVLPAT